jgi:integrase
MEVLEEGRVVGGPATVAATTPGRDSFQAALKLLTMRRSKHIPVETADLVLASMPPNTIRTRTTAWNNWLRWCAAARLPPLEPTSTTVLACAADIASRSKRPQGSINNLFTTFNILGELEPVFDLHLPPQDEAADWMPYKVLKRATRGIIRLRTSRGVKKQPFLDVPRVLQQIKTTFTELSSHRDDDTATYRQWRDVAIAGFCAVVPSRSEEIAGLQQRDVLLYVPTEVLGVRATSARLHELSTDYLAGLLNNKEAAWHLIVELRKSKTDPSMAGIPKRLQHVAGAEWTPARAIIAAAVASRKALKVSRATARSPLFHDAQAYRRGLMSEPDHLQPATISRILEATARAATGEQGISARGWRPAAASWLLRCGVPKEVVVALGGWSSAKSLRRFYVRNIPISTQALQELYVILPSVVTADDRPVPQGEAQAPRSSRQQSGVPASSNNSLLRATIDARVLEARRRRAQQRRLS